MRLDELSAIRERFFSYSVLPSQASSGALGVRAERRFVRWQVFVCFEHVVSSVCKVPDGNRFRSGLGLPATISGRQRRHTIITRQRFAGHERGQRA